MWIWHRGSQEEFERFIVCDCFVTQFENKSRAILDLLLEQDRLKSWI